MNLESWKLENRLIFWEYISYLIFTALLIVGGLLFWAFARYIPILEDSSSRFGRYGAYFVNLYVIPIYFGLAGYWMTSIIACNNTKYPNLDLPIKIKSYALGLGMNCGILVTGLVFLLGNGGVLVILLLGELFIVFSIIGISMIIVFLVLAIKRKDTQ